MKSKIMIVISIFLMAVAVNGIAELGKGGGYFPDSWVREYRMAIDAPDGMLWMDNLGTGTAIRAQSDFGTALEAVSNDSGTALHVEGASFFEGEVNATTFYGDGSNLSGVQPALNSKFRAYVSDRQLFGPDEVKIEFNTESYDTNDEYDVDLDRFVASRSGFYLVHYCLYFVTLGDTNPSEYVKVKKNGTTTVLNYAYTPQDISEDTSLDPLSFRYHVQQMTIVELEAGDYLEVFAIGGTESRPSIQEGPGVSYFGVFQLG